jgi:uncharacterized protein YbjT (DUF2867 family)
MEVSAAPAGAAHEVFGDAEAGRSDEIFVRLPATFGRRIKVIPMKWASDELDVRRNIVKRSTS